MKPLTQAAVAEDLRKMGTTIVAASMVAMFISDHRLLTGCTFLVGVIVWIIGIFLTQEV